MRVSKRKLLLTLRKWLISFESFFYSTSINLSIGQRRRGNVTLVSNVCEARPIFLFWVLKGLDELLEMRFEFPFNLIGKSTIPLITGISWRVFKSLRTGGSKTRIRCCLADRLNQKFSSVCDTGYPFFWLDVIWNCIVPTVGQKRIFSFQK